MHSILQFDSETQATFSTVVSPFVRDSGLSFIEQLTAISKNPCTRPPQNWLLGKDPLTKVAILIQPRCKTWACPTCGAGNARRWIARIINGVNHMDGIWWMFTLTAHENWRGQTASVLNLRQGWHKLMKRARREFGNSTYCKVWEMHADGTFHLHGLVDRNWGERWLKDNARECGIGYQVDIHPVDNAGQVAGYIAKYMLKSGNVQKEGYVFPKNLHRIEVSQNWLKLPELAEFERFQWGIYKSVDAAKRYADWLQRDNWRIVDLLPQEYSYGQVCEIQEIPS